MPETVATATPASDATSVMVGRECLERLRDAEWLREYMLNFYDSFAGIPRLYRQSVGRHSLLKAFSIGEIASFRLNVNLVFGPLEPWADRNKWFLDTFGG